MVEIASVLQPTLLKVQQPALRRRRRSPHRQFRRGRRAAAVRALNAARLYLQGVFPTLAEAAEARGSNIAYVRAAATLLKADNASLVSDVLRGRAPLLTAAAEAKRLVDLVTAYKLAKGSGSHRVRARLRDGSDPQRAGDGEQLNRRDAAREGGAPLLRGALRCSSDEAST